MREIVFQEIKKNPSLVKRIRDKEDPIYINYLNRFFPELENLQIGCDCYQNIMQKQGILESSEEQYILFYRKYFDLEVDGEINESNARIDSLFSDIMGMLSSNDLEQVEKAKLAIEKLNERMDHEYSNIESQLEEEHKIRLRKIINKKVIFLSKLQEIKNKINKPSLYKTLFGVAYKEKKLRSEFERVRTEYEEYNYFQEYDLSAKDWENCVSELQNNGDNIYGIPGIMRNFQQLVNISGLEQVSEPRFGRITAMQRLRGILDSFEGDLGINGRDNLQCRRDLETEEQRQ